MNEKQIEEMISRLLDKKLAQISTSPAATTKTPRKRPEPGPFLKQLMEASERIPSGSRRQGIRFKLGKDSVETSIESGLKDEVEALLELQGMTVSKVCHAALVMVLEEARNKKL